MYKRQGLDVSSLRITDGSGLAPTNKVTARFLNDLLTYMVKSKHAEAFMSSLPQAGVEGSVRNFLKESSLSGKAFLKSGSMSGVRCYAGYVKNQGKTYSVVLLTNNYSMSSWTINRRLEQVLIGLFGQENTMLRQEIEEFLLIIIRNRNIFFSKHNAIALDNFNLLRLDNE